VEPTAACPVDPTDQPGIDTDIPARLERLPWSRFHCLLIVALGVTWILDGLKVTVVAAISPVLKEEATLMIAAAVVELVLGVASERRSLEDVAAPLSTQRPRTASLKKMVAPEGTIR
jgi:hypothetical protein